jgi:pimeloyl-ACP methyl ester carboxylesterase
LAVIVLVHGAFHGGWCWKKLTPLLKASGQEVYTPTLTGLGERTHLLSREINLDSHIKDVVNTLEFEDLEDVILVGHSYGGMVISGAAELVPDRVGHLVYLDAVTPQDGQAFSDCFPDMVAQFRRMAAEDGDGWLVRYRTELGTWGVTEKNEVRWLMERLAPQPIATFEQKVRFRNPAALALPKTLIWCSGSGQSSKRDVKESRPCLPPSFPSGWGFYEIRTGHDAMIIAPGEVARILIEVAKGS